MINLHARAGLNRALAPVGRTLAGWGVSPNAVTVVGTVGVVGGALGFYPRGDFLTGTIVITCFVFSDMLDGAIARARGSTGVFGAFLDSTLDRMGDAAVFGGLVLWFAGGGHSLLMAGVALYDLVAGSLTSYIKARAESLRLSCNVGLAERSERLLAILIATGFTGIFGVPALQVVVLWVLAGAMTVTVIQRLVEVRRQARAALAAAGDGGLAAPLAPAAPTAPAGRPGPPGTTEPAESPAATAPAPAAGGVPARSAPPPSERPVTR
jgi:CDP-diacylglycerol--glycerol-3-phosphate 3-phosphatidyltransferase